MLLSDYLAQHPEASPLFSESMVLARLRVA
jgi:hypothetical protein